jgi:sugar lactone lactonase YvrE
MPERPLINLISVALFVSAILLTSCGVSQPASSSSLRWFDSSGNLYIADSGNNVIRKVDATSGVITTVAGNGFGAGSENVGNASSGGYSGDGGPATSAELYYPLDVAFDRSDNLYIADAGNNVIRKVDAQTGIISTFAGNGTNPTTSSGNAWGIAGGYSGDGGLATAAQLSWPSGIAFDQTGHLYIADTGNNVIRKVDANTGVITTVAGNGFGARLQRWGSGAYSGDGGPAISAELNWPTGIAVDDAGNLFIADTNNSRVRKVDAQSGIITTVAGNGSFSWGDWPIHGVDGPATSATVSWPTGVALDKAGHIYVVNSGNPVVLINKIDANTGVLSIFAGTQNPGYSGDGGPATAADMNYPCSLAVDGHGDVFTGDVYNYVVRKIDSVSGTISTVAGNGTEGYSGDGGQASSANLSGPFDTGS